MQGCFIYSQGLWGYMTSPSCLPSLYPHVPHRAQTVAPVSGGVLESHHVVLCTTYHNNKQVFLQCFILHRVSVNKSEAVLCGLIGALASAASQGCVGHMACNYRTGGRSYMFLCTNSAQSDAPEEPDHNPATSTE